MHSVTRGMGRNQAALGTWFEPCVCRPVKELSERPEASDGIIGRHLLKPGKAMSVLFRCLTRGTMNCFHVHPLSKNFSFTLVQLSSHLAFSTLTIDQCCRILKS